MNGVGNGFTNTLHESVLTERCGLIDESFIADRINQDNPTVLLGDLER